MNIDRALKLAVSLLHEERHRKGSSAPRATEAALILDKLRDPKVLAILDALKL